MIDHLGHGITCIDAGYERPGMAACYLLREGSEVAVIETGTTHSVPRILAALADGGLEPAQVRYIIPTHVHLDHAGGAGALLAHCPAATLVVHPRGLRHLVDPRALVEGAMAVYGEAAFARLYGEIVPAPAARARPGEDGDVLMLGGRPLLLRHTPGHALHHFCVWDAASRGWFAGDAFGIGYPELAAGGRAFLFPATTPVQFDPAAYRATIDTLMAAGPAAFYLTHYGRIAASAEGAHALLEQLGEYERIAVAARAGGPDETLRERLRAALLARTLERLADFGGPGAAAAMRFLAADMDLNAQGLEVWLRRRSA